jgi:hypothetical protein
MPAILATLEVIRRIIKSIKEEWACWVSSAFFKDLSGIEEVQGGMGRMPVS